MAVSQRMGWGSNSPSVPYQKSICTVSGLLTMFYPTRRVLKGGEEVAAGGKKKA